MLPPTVFFSHSSINNDDCRQILERLQEADVDVWYDEHFLKGQVLSDEIHGYIQRCDNFLLALSPAAAHSPWVQQECRWAIEAQKRFIIIVVTDLADADKAVLPTYMSSSILHWATTHPQDIQSTTKRILDFLGLIPRPALLRLFGHTHQKQGTVALEPGTQVCLYVDPMDAGQLYFTLGGTAHVPARHYLVVQRVKDGAAPCRWAFIEQALVTSQSQLTIQCNEVAFPPQRDIQAQWTPLQDGDRFDLQNALTDEAKATSLERSQVMFSEALIEDPDILIIPFTIEYHGYA